MAARIACIQHQDAVPPGAIAGWVATRGHELAVIRPDRGEPLDPAAGADVVCILGGSMDVSDAATLPWLQAEREWLAALLARPYRDRPALLGICLGGQLIADALGAQITTLDSPERGWWPLRLTPAGLACGLLLDAPPVTHVFQSHRQGFSIPRGAATLAESDAWPNQAFAWGDDVVALQFHPEFTPQVVRGVQRSTGSWEGPWVQQHPDLADFPEHFDAQHALLHHLLDRLAAVRAAGRLERDPARGR